ncbi:hypothetical protein F2P81_023421 [Scophthalmus maximus]|uniref:Uncharacterized protein n=1 Tax=Scophthalmus maximus TaxID=52904 RepID=A0A6A4RWD7_SCOMX|nr:hypothetical protein F2P81_023421 [Scophthalmus maximus]
MELSSGSGTAKLLNRDRFLEKASLSEMQLNPEAVTFELSAPETFKTSVGDVSLRPSVCARVYSTWQLLELREMSDTRGRCATLSPDQFACRPPLGVAAELCADGLAPLLGGSWEKVKIHMLLTLFEQFEDSLDQLLIKALTKLGEESPVRSV